MTVNEITHEIIGAAIEVHRVIGPGLLETAYQQCLAREMNLRKMTFQEQIRLPVEYKGMQVDCGYRLDFLVAEEVVVELKTVEKLQPIHQAQILTYMKLGHWKTGLLINFHTPVLKEGIRRFVL